MTDLDGGDAGGGQRAEPLPPHDYDPFSYDQARYWFTYGLPEAQPGDSLTSAPLDREVERLVQIGRYMIDRWSAIEAVQPGPAFERRRSEAMDNCTFGHIKWLQYDSDKRIREYLDRKRPILDCEVIQTQILSLETNITTKIIAAIPPKQTHWRPAWLRWLMREFGAGPVAAFGVIAFAILLQLTFPRVVEAARVEFGKLFSGAPAVQVAPAQVSTVANSLTR